MKMSIVGLGNVGRALAYALVLRGLPRELVLVGTDDDKLAGEALDLQHAATLVRPMHVRAGGGGGGGGGGADGTEGSDLVFLTASRPADPDTAADRMALAEPNARLFGELVPPLAAASPGAVFVVLSNPLDVMTYVTFKAAGLPDEARGRVLGTGTLLDTARFRAGLAGALAADPLDVHAYVLGEHGDTQFPALLPPSPATLGGTPIVPTLIAEVDVRARFEETRRAGGTVAGLKGHTNFGVATAAVHVAEAIVGDRRAVLPVSSVLELPEHGLSDVALSLPCLVGAGGVQRVLPPALADDEARKLHDSAAFVRSAIAGLDRSVYVQT